MNGLDKQRWERLLLWLRDEHGMNTADEGFPVEARDIEGAGRGLFALKYIPASKPHERTPELFNFPSSALMNVRTVSKLYTSIDWQILSGIQLVSMHLLLHKPSGDADSLDPAFGPYISTLPRDFSSHPLTWFVKGELEQADNWETRILEILPPSTYRRASALFERFWTDWKVAFRVMTEVPEVLASSSRTDIALGSVSLHGEHNRLIMDYLWAWLNVNTRCIWYLCQWPPSHLDNFTLCPVVDFANHDRGRTHIFPQVSSDVPGTLPQRNLVCFGPAESAICEGQELCLKYGDRSNCIFFSEYGFVNNIPYGAVANGAYRGEVNVQDLVIELFADKGTLGAQLKEILRDAGYWGDWTMYSWVEPAHPDYRLITAMRLLHAVVDVKQPEFEARVDAWRNVMYGQTDRISSENEDLWRKSLYGLCGRIVERARMNLSKLSVMDESPGWRGWMVKNVRTLWMEEHDVAEAVSVSLEAGVDF